MGEHNIRSEIDTGTRQKFIRHLLDDVETLAQMLKEGKIEEGIARIGAEQEFCLVDDTWRPSIESAKVLKAVDDSHYTTELAKYNIEINLDPFELKDDAFSLMEAQLMELLKKASEKADDINNKVVLTGILPSISLHELSLDFMTDNPRYLALNNKLRDLRGGDFNMHLSGVDELSIIHDSVMFEACNTSFQMHLQIDPDDFASSHNWAQAISGPVLGLSVNSPLLLGRELWQETRVALFQQSIDTRNVSYALKDQNARVSFGQDWVKGTVADYFKNEISHYRIILAREIDQCSSELLESGITPKLCALNLHNGTIYRWNRPCYGVGGGKAHVRIENRYIPSGPTIIDQMANFAFWVGLMKGRPEKYDDMKAHMSFKDAKSNFIKAARYGSESVMNWMGKEVTVKELIATELLPIARRGLEMVNIAQKDIDRLLGVIEDRLKGQTGSQWMIKSYRNLRADLKKDEALIALTEAIYENQKVNRPVHDWGVVQRKTSPKSNATKIGHIMTSGLFTAFQEDTAELILQIMAWKDIHHLPVVDHNERLVGLLTWSHIQRFSDEISSSERIVPVSEIMVTNLHTAESSTPIQEAIALMKEHEIGCLPVLHKKHLVGIVTIKDLLAFDNE